ncbi:MAG: Uma2 family endonuclease [Candidatus Competibacteraceae bacterium]|jgi:Uma2 family endonuclease|nr:Uma2 family endonuclease [Candidatus Competibacteraceae bacterium]
MASVRKALWLSPQDYLDGELHSDIKHEYVAGYVYAMTGASEPHNLITGNLFAALHAHLRGKPCRVFINVMKVRTETAFYYPDIMVCCDPGDTEAYYKTCPALIIEVLSPTTERADTLEKRIAYQTLTSLQEYVLVVQERPEVNIYRRIVDGWELETLSAGDQVSLRSVDLQLPIELIYEDVL